MARRAASAVVLAVLAVPVPSAAQDGFVDNQKRKQALEHYRAGEALLRTERFAEAEPELAAAVQLDPLLAGAHYSLGQVYMAMKRYVEAQGALRAAIDAHNRMVSLRQRDRSTADTRAREEIHELRDSIRAVRSGQAKAQQPENVILKLESRVQELENALGRGAAETMAVPAEFHLSLGSAYFRGGKLAEAASEYESAARARKNFGEAHNNLAVVYMLLGRFDESEQQLKAAKKAGFAVHPQFEKDLETKRRAAARQG